MIANGKHLRFFLAAAISMCVVSAAVGSEPIENKSALLDLSKEEQRLDARLRQIWTLYGELLTAGDFEGAAAQWVPFVRVRMTERLEKMGQAARTMPEQWSDLILLDLEEDKARYAFHTPTSLGDAVYEVEFVRWPDGAWLIEVVR